MLCNFVVVTLVCKFLAVMQILGWLGELDELGGLAALAALAGLAGLAGLLVMQISCCYANSGLARRAG